MAHSRFYVALITGTIVSGMFGAHAFAADIMDSPLPAVSAVNGKVEFGGGFADLQNTDSDPLFYGAGTLSIPLGTTFGFQADVAATHMFGDTGIGTTGHLFTRDPNSYLLGVIGGFGDAGDANALWAGGEAELYMNNISFELAGGYMNVDPNGAPSKDKAFVMGDLGFYATDNFRLSLGASSVAGFESVHGGFEYLLADMPLSLKADLRVGEDNFVAAKAGLSFYFGGNEANKSLIRRHREDDPRNRVLDIFGAGAGAFNTNNGATAGEGGGPKPVCDFDPETPLPFCESYL